MECSSQDLSLLFTKESRIYHQVLHSPKVQAKDTVCLSCVRLCSQSQSQSLVMEESMWTLWAVARGRSLVPTREEEEEEAGVSRDRGSSGLDIVWSSVHHRRWTHRLGRVEGSHGKLPCCRYQPNNMLLGVGGGQRGYCWLLSSGSQGALFPFSVGLGETGDPRVALPFWGKRRSTGLTNDQFWISNGLHLDDRLKSLLIMLFVFE